MNKGHAATDQNIMLCLPWEQFSFSPKRDAPGQGTLFLSYATIAHSQNILFQKVTIGKHWFIFLSVPKEFKKFSTKACSNLHLLLYADRNTTREGRTVPLQSEGVGWVEWAVQKGWSLWHNEKTCCSMLPNYKFQHHWNMQPFPLHKTQFRQYHLKFQVFVHSGLSVKAARFVRHVIPSHHCVMRSAAGGSASRQYRGQQGQQPQDQHDSIGLRCKRRADQKGKRLNVLSSTFLFSVVQILGTKIGTNYLKQ